jgi:hypothetical protein
VNGAESFVRFYNTPESERKNSEVRGDEVYYKGKRCK